MNPQVKQIADRIKELREILELSKEELAGKVGISVEQYDIYERAGEDIPIGVLYGLAACMYVVPSVFADGRYAAHGGVYHRAGRKGRAGGTL